MSADTARTNGLPVLADDPYRVGAEHLPDAAVVLFDRDLRFGWRPEPLCLTRPGARTTASVAPWSTWSQLSRPTC